MFLIRFTQTSSSWYFYVLNQLSAHGKNIWQRWRRRRRRRRVIRAERSSFNRRQSLFVLADVCPAAASLIVCLVLNKFLHNSLLCSHFFFCYSLKYVWPSFGRNRKFSKCMSDSFFFFREIPQDTSCLCVFNCCCKMSKVYSVVTRLL